MELCMLLASFVLHLLAANLLKELCKSSNSANTPTKLVANAIECQNFPS